jgi:hypothetical protein
LFVILLFKSKISTPLPPGTYRTIQKIFLSRIYAPL